jgi:drug/metabolite transporter (DMT)-like permease
MTSNYVYALVSILAWAVSGPVITYGLKQIPGETKARGILLGLLISLLSGTASLSLWVLPHARGLDFSFPLIAAGVFTFPVATGLYYLSGYAFGGKVEIASQFTRVKPLFSVAFAALVLGELLTSRTWISLAFVAVGTILFLIGSLRGTFRFVALLLGLLAALSWAIGEIFIKLGTGGSTAINSTFVSLCSATLAFVPVAFPAILKRPSYVTPKWAAPFIFHGIVSFGIGYACFYASIRAIGVGKTALLTAFWPATSLVLGWAISRARKENTRLPRVVWIASILLLLGSLIQALDF